MLPYWFFFLIPVGVLFVCQRLADRTQTFFWGLVWLFFVLAIGFRFEVGADWFQYIYLFEIQSAKGLWEAVIGSDPGYYLLNWLVSKAGGSIYWVNTVCGMIVMTGVVSFARRQPLPWLALLVATPYLIIVVGMGYTRQSAALGLLMIGLSALGSGQLRWFIFWVMLGATFHKSAVLLLPVAALAATSNRFWSLFWVGLVSLLGGYLFVFDSAEQLWTVYVEADHYQSEGGLIRVLMNAVPAVLFLVFQRSLRLSEIERKLWFWMSLLALACIPLVILSSTATDRVALYLIPIQMFVFARLPFVVTDPRHRGLITLAVVGYYGLVQAVWLFFAGNAWTWLPYQTFFSINGSVGV